MSSKNNYDFALSFAGEDRSLVEEIAEYLRLFQCTAFYDEWEKHTLIGEDLYTYLADIYENKAKYCVVFISKHYTNKRWPKHEKKFAFARDFADPSTYILPVRIDDSYCAGIPETVGYIDAQKLAPSQIAILLLKKLGREIYTGDSPDILIDKKVRWNIFPNGDIHAEIISHFIYVGDDKKEEHTYRIWSPSNETLRVKDLNAYNNQQHFDVNIISDTRRSCEYEVKLTQPLQFADTIQYSISYRCERYFDNPFNLCEDTFRVSIPIWSLHYDFRFPKESIVDVFESFRLVEDESIGVPCRSRLDAQYRVYSVTMKTPKVGTKLKIRFKLQELNGAV